MDDEGFFIELACKRKADREASLCVSPFLWGKEELSSACFEYSFQQGTTQSAFVIGEDPW